MAQDYTYDVCVLNSHPLINTRDQQQKLTGEIDTDSFCKQVRNGLTASGKRIRYIELLATKDNLTNILFSGARILQFNMHGSPNHELVLEQNHIYEKSRVCQALRDALLPKNEIWKKILEILDLYIPQENPTTSVGWVDSLSRNELDFIWENAPLPPQMIIVNAKHGIKSAQLFRPYGYGSKYPIITMNYEYCTRDRLIYTFLNQFYQCICSGNFLVATAFRVPQLVNRHSSPIVELFPNKFNCEGAGPRDAIQLHFQGRPDGILEDETLRIINSSISGNFRMPPAVPNGLGRHGSIFQIIQQLTSPQTLATIHWIHGIESFGKTALVNMVCHYLAERKIMKNILFLEIPVFDYQSAIDFLYEALTSEGSSEWGEDRQFMPKLEETTISEEILIKSINLYMKIPTLIIFDNVNINDSNRKVLEFFRRFLDACPQFKIIVTSRIICKMEIDELEIKPFEVKPLNQRAAVRLFLHSFNQTQLEDFFDTVEENAMYHPIIELVKFYHVPGAVMKVVNFLKQIRDFQFDKFSTDTCLQLSFLLQPYNFWLYADDQNILVNDFNKRQSLLTCSLETARFGGYLDQFSKNALRVLITGLQQYFQEKYHNKRIFDLEMPDTEQNFDFGQPGAEPGAEKIPEIVKNEPNIFDLPPQSGSNSNLSLDQKQNNQIENIAPPDAVDSPVSSAVPIPSISDEQPGSPRFSQNENSPQNWTTHEVGIWLVSLGQKYSRYVPALEENGIDGECMLEIFTSKEAMKELGFTAVHQIVLTKKVKHLFSSQPQGQFEGEGVQQTF